jgi:hypothetical protein
MTRPLGKGEVESSILSCSTINPQENKAEPREAAEAGCAELRMNDSGTAAENWQGADHCLYRHFDADGVLLYVGITLSIGVRTSAHRRGAPWFRDVARIEVAHFTSRADCALAERVAIHTEKPLHNRSRANVSMADLVAVKDALPPRGVDVRPTPYLGTREEQAARAAFDALDLSR